MSDYVDHQRKTTKIGAEWKYFCETQSFKAGTEIVFEFPDPTVKHGQCIIFKLCLTTQILWKERKSKIPVICIDALTLKRWYICE